MDTIQLLQAVMLFKKRTEQIEKNSNIITRIQNMGQTLFLTRSKSPYQLGQLKTISLSVPRSYICINNLVK